MANLSNLPKQMKALRYEKPEDWSIVQVPLPELRENDVLVKVRACGVCGTGESILRRILHCLCRASAAIKQTVGEHVQLTPVPQTWYMTNPP
ncbi:Alcohol dehydrogenase GroES-like domain-containing protein [Colletotrichum higginsianum IMI 349063]|uniref:Alcohol dehydrogenase GroES-like domain-containing protein n=1 Tax=Colletotrichum higginsianum (strain IMI 349063) TaxID=759273 RepID=A0A1B7Y1W0_COLHI|nr:Alcohol dehydrogenase GroES-like domain-containing protein [Colletotrichum higginsianum IMI 349063]OBR06003.1 Alcohol dehydrogenase GroES-like domain-containing protein [Colletotrichum higginsianum IMI 349063]